MVAETEGKFLHHCSCWRYEHQAHSKEVEKAMWWNASLCLEAQILVLISIEICEKEVMDFLVATDIRLFPLG